jgi:hypothetical protein
MIDCHLHNRTFQNGKWDAIAIAKAEHAFIGYLDWADQSRLKLEAAEISLVSEKYQYGGTMDLVTMHKGGLTLLDYKTSNGIYAEMLCQLGGYALLWTEHYPDKPLKGAALLRIGKPKHPDDPVSFEHRYFSAEIFPLVIRQFLLFREAYDLDKRLHGLL